jgi:acetyl-CoA acetyltransferase
MREAVIVASCRTPLAKSHRGSFNMTRPDDLAAHCTDPPATTSRASRHCAPVFQ